MKTGDPLKKTPQDITIKPIGYFSSLQVEPYQASRQPDQYSNPGQIVLYEKNNYEQALQDLEGCSHIWIIFLFHQNSNWKPLVQTPRSEKKIGVFATRAPYRPNPIGLSVVKLLAINGLTLEVGPNDILDGTPVLDIKPYHPESDLVQDTSILWLEDNHHLNFTVVFSPFAESQLDFVEKNGVFDFKNFLLRQLSCDPTNKNKKRVKKISNDLWEISYRTWRADFFIHDKTISIIAVKSGYSENDLIEQNDPYQDKIIHQKFKKEFS